MTQKIVTSLFILLMIFATGVTAQQVDIQELLDQTPVELKNQVRNTATVSNEVAATLQNMYQHNYSKETVGNFLNKVEQYQKQGYPVSDLTNSVNEGISNRANGQQISNTLNKVHKRQEFASRFAAQFSNRTQARHQIEENVKAAMTAGMQQDHLQELARAMDQDRVRDQTRDKDIDQDRDRYQDQDKDQVKDREQLSLEVTETARIMSKLGVKSAATADLIGKAINNNFTHQEIRQMKQAFMNNFSHMHANRYTNMVSNNITSGKRGADAAQGFDGSTTGGKSGNGAGSSSGMGGSSSGGSGGNSGGGNSGNHK